MPQPAHDSAGVGFPPPVMFLLGIFVGVILQFIWSLPFIPWQIGMIAGLVAIVLGAILIASAAFMFRSAGTAMPPWETASAVVMRGPYRFTRNPMYLGMALIHAGVGLGLTSVWILLMLVPVLWWINTRVIAREERYMAEKFGQSYQDYCQTVRRWL